MRDARGARAGWAGTRSVTGRGRWHNPNLRTASSPERLAKEKDQAQADAPGSRGAGLHPKLRDSPGGTATADGADPGASRSPRSPPDTSGLPVQHWGDGARRAPAGTAVSPGRFASWAHGGRHRRGDI